MKKSIPTITEKMLIHHLKQLETDRLIIRKSKPVVPPYVTYELSKSGKALRRVLYAMAEGTVNNSGKQSKQFLEQMADFPKE